MENKPSEHLNNIFTITPTNGSGYLDNDTIKQTIIAQEATFREQVIELHRVYNVQKNLMELECQRGELSKHSQEKMYSSPYGRIRTVRQVEPPAGHDMKKPSKKFMKGKDLVCSSNGVSMRHSSSRPTQEKLAFQVSDDAHANNTDDDVVILSEKPANSSVRNKSSSPGTNVKDLQVPADAHDDDNDDDDVVILLEKPTDRWPITNGSILGTNAKDLQVQADAHANDSDDDVVILSEKHAKSLPRKHGSILGTNLKNILVPISAHVYDCDDDVVILLEKSANNLPRNNGSILGINVKLNSEGSSRVNKEWTNSLQPSDVSTTNVLNKEVVGPSSNMETTNFPSVGSSSSQNQVYSFAGVTLNLPDVKLEIEPSSHVKKNHVSGLQQSHVSTLNAFNTKVVGSSSTMKIEDFPSVGASSSQNQCYSSLGLDLNLPSLEDTLNGKHVGAAIDSNFLVANEETQHNNSYIHKKYDRSNVMECFTHEKKSVDSSTTNDMSSCSIRNPKTFVASSSNATSKSLRKSNTKDYKNGCLPTLQEYCRLPTPKTTQPGGGQYQKQSRFYNCVEDMNLSNGPRDATATPGEAREDTPMEISWVKKKLLNMRKGISMKKSQVPSNYATGHSHILPSSMAYSEGSSKILGYPINTTTEKDPQLSCIMHKGTDDMSSSKGVANMEMQFHKKDDTNARNPIDLNVALPFMDEMEIDAHAPESNTIPQEPDDSSNEDHVVTAAKNLMAMHKVEFQAGLPGGNNNDDDSEAIEQHLFKTKHHISSSTLLSKENKRSKDHGVASASTSNVQFKRINTSRRTLCQVPRILDDAYHRSKRN
ncbi:hypothetical protein CFC21_076263 [Triticum aestivum]|uniref:Uncharacterized protein n=3 Tax=Triticinae TaxID=1648030 RepID=A0A453JW49_AEGTS|nr:uncharacterized protein LOC120964376 [Aegilops tauschii subsp. strangulata]XP_044396218.1 uncharacterized protein LOC123120312 [Triticum aestivum]KAF7070804.1 hypothetical protein CFC21_076263 [Triticum aestivum]